MKIKINLKLQQPFKDLLKPYRYKVYYGGRGSGKSYNFAVVLLVLSLQKKIRVLCAREFQNSINDSVYKLLKDLIYKYKLPYFEILNTTIKNTLTGSEFIFKGLKHNIQSIKSLEGIDICWVEEAHTVSEESWDILIPTIRKPNSEIWISFNPYSETDATYKRFVLSTPPNTLLKKVTYKDNKYFPKVLKRELEFDKKTNYEKYLHIWEGECLTLSDAQVFKDKYEVGTIPNEVLKRAYDIYLGSDFGFAKDPTTLIKLYKLDDILYIDSEAYGIGVEINDIPNLYAKVEGYKDYLIRADSSQPMTISYLKNKGLRITGAKKWQGSVIDGINYLKSFRKIIISPNCKHTLEEFRLYSYKTNSAGDILPELEDKNNHCIDAIRYALEPLIRQSKTKAFRLKNI